MEPIHAAGLLLTGGASSRMGRDKALLPVGGEPMAGRVARALTAVAYPVLQVGSQAVPDLETIDDPRDGPLVAITAGADALAARGHDGPVLVVACDIPFIEPALLGHLLARLGGHDAAVPVLGGRDQSLCACYAAAALRAARDLARGGTRAVRDWLGGLDVARVPEDEWHAFGRLDDVDTPEEYDAVRDR